MNVLAWYVEEKRRERLRALSTEQLKAAWDAFDDTGENPKDGPDIEDVHRMLNERGEGSYCAV